MHTHRRVMVIFTVFVVLAVVGSFLIFYYQRFVDELLGSYVSAITVCGNILDESTCLTREACEPIYGPAGPNDPRLEFRTCQRKTLLTLINEERLQYQCVKTGGEWYKNNFGAFCLCQKTGTNMIFNRQQGCVSKAR